jgi:hypothetical protein
MDKMRGIVNFFLFLTDLTNQVVAQGIYLGGSFERR